MAESYVTKFARTVKSNYDSLKTNLKNKGIPVSTNDTLGNLVEKVNDINVTFSYPKYERDENLPDIDALFEADTLRLVNGGTYKYCSYFLSMLDEQNRVTQYNSSNCDFLKFSDGHTIDVSSQTSEYNTYVVQSNGIFTDNDDNKYCWVAVYSNRQNDIITLTSNCKEVVTDYVSLSRSLNYILLSSTNSSYATMPPNQNFEQYQNYVRFAGTNVTKENPYIYPNYSSNYVCARFLQIDGFCNYYNNQQTYINGRNLMQKCIFNAELVNDFNLLYLRGYNNSSYEYSSHLDYFKTPYSEQNIHFETAGLIISELYITDNVYKVTLGVSTGNLIEQNTLEKIHFGSAIEEINFKDNNTTNSASLTNLKYITVSEGAFGNNEDAYTLNLSAAFYLTRQSVLNLINGLADRTNKTANVLKLSTRSKSLVTDEEKAILTAKNWTIS